MKTLRNNRGFTLLEVMIAIFIISIGISAILVAENNSLEVTMRAKRMTTVAMLAKNALIQAERDIENKTFDETRKETSGTFDGAYTEYKWERKIKEITFPNVMDAASAEQKEGLDPNVERVVKIATTYLSKATREVTITILWTEKKQEQKFSVSQYWVDLDRDMILTLSKRRRQQQQGFTLIEVMIALFILAMIGFMTSKAVVDAAQLKEILKGETEFSNEVRTSIGFIERDLSQIFNPRWFLAPDAKPIDPYNQQLPPPGGQPGGTQPATPPKMSNEQLNRVLRGTAFQTFEYWGPLYDATGIRASRFQGKEASMSFVTASHSRIYQQKKESIYAKVKYELVKQPPNPNLNKFENDKLAGLYQLIKTENTHAFEVEEPRAEATYVNTYIVLNNIKSLKFKYYKPDTKDALPAWDSEAEENRGKFPEAVELDALLVAPNDRSMDAKVLFKLEAPNDVLPKTY